MQPRFFTGVYGRFCPQQVLRETRPHFAGLEVSCLGSLHEAEAVATFARERQLGLGVHFPLVRSAGSDGAAHPLIMAKDDAVRGQALSAVAGGLETAASIGAEYLVIHFPKPSILSRSLDWSDWRFPQAGESMFEQDTSVAEQRRLAEVAFSTLDCLAKRSTVRIVLEHDILHSLFYQSLLPELFAAFPRIGFCLDLGRLHLQQHTDPGFSGTRFIEQMLPFITNLHLWTVRLGENKQGGHHPILPHLRAEEGWGENEAYLRALSALNQADVMFEHRSELVSEAELDCCYNWAESMLTGRPGAVGTETC